MCKDWSLPRGTSSSKKSPEQIFPSILSVGFRVSKMHKKKGKEDEEKEEEIPFFFCSLLMTHTKGV